MATKSYPDTSSSMSAKLQCPLCTSALRPVSISQSAVSRRLHLQYTATVRVQSRRKPAEPSIRSSSSTYRPYLAPITLRTFYYQLSCRSVPSTSGFSVLSVPLLVSGVDDGILRRLDLPRSQLVLPFNRGAQKLRKLSSRLLRKIVGIARRLKNALRSLSKR